MRTSTQGGFRELYREHYAFVWHTVRRFGVPPMSVEDAVQDTFVTAYRRRRDFDGHSARAWLYSIGRRVASNHRRTRHRVERRHREASEVRPSVRPTEDWMMAKNTLEAFLVALPTADRELFVLSEVDGLTGPELAQSLGRNLATLYSRVRILRHRFATFLGKDASASAGADVIRRGREERPRASVAGWAALLPRLELGAAVTKVATTGIVGSLGSSALGYVGGGVVAAAVLVGVGAGASADTSHSPESSTPMAVGAGIAVVEPGLTRPSSAPTTASTEASPIALAPSGERDSGSVAHDPSGVPARPSPRRSRRRSEDPAQTAPDLAADTSLLQEAGRTLRRGEAPAALRQLDEHAARFARSPQADLRRALRVEALCELGRAEDAHDVSQALFDHRPTTPVAKRLRSSCAAGPWKPAR